jgi:ATP-binding cassette subfamily B protein AbcA/BmrA
VQEILALLRAGKANKVHFALALLLGVVSSFFSVYPLQFLAALSDRVIGKPVDASTAWVNWILDRSPQLFPQPLLNQGLVTLGFFLIFSVIAHFLRNLYGYICTILSEKLIINLRKSVFEHLIEFPLAFFSKNSKGEVINKCMVDTQKVENVFSQPMFTMLSDLFDLVWITIILASIDPVLPLLLIPTLPILYVMSLRTGKLQRSMMLELRNEEGRMSGKIEQVLSNIEYIKAVNAQEVEARAFAMVGDSSLTVRTNAAKNLSKFFPIEGSVRVAGTCVLMAYAVFQVTADALSVGTLLVLYNYATRFFAPVANMTRYYQTLQSGLASGKRVLDFLQLPKESDEQYQRTLLASSDQDVLSADGISLAFDGRNVLEHVDFRVSKGEFVIVKGESGRGKSTLIKVLLGLLPVDQGWVRTPHALGDIDRFRVHRSSFSYVGQNSYLRDLSVLDNVIYPLVRSETDIDAAVRTLEALGIGSDRHEHKVGENAAMVSGGEARRIAIARALARPAPYLVLDEATSNLDIDTENAVIDLLKSQKGVRSIIFVTHSENPRLYALADRIVTLDKTKNVPQNEVMHDRRFAQ